MTVGLDSAAMADIVNTNQFKNGMHIELEGSVWRIVEFQHVKPGKGGAFVRTKLKNARLRRRRRPDLPRRREVPAHPHRGRRACSTSTTRATRSSSWTRRPTSRSRCRARRSPTRSTSCSRRRRPALAVDGSPAGIQLPASVELTVTETEPGVKGDTVSNVTKPATLETGAVVQVPLFVNEGERIKVDTRERRYISRA